MPKLRLTISQVFDVDLPQDVTIEEAAFETRGFATGMLAAFGEDGADVQVEYCSEDDDE